jgi:hypothetical protein
MTNYAMSYPAINGETVTQGHADYCAEHGHGTYKVGGVDQGTCPRCGDVTEVAQPGDDHPLTTKINNYTVASATGRAYVYTTVSLNGTGERTICIGRTKREAVSNSTMRNAFASRWVARDRGGKLLGDFYTRKAAVAEIIRYYEWWIAEGIKR